MKTYVKGFLKGFGIFIFINIIVAVIFALIIYLFFDRTEEVINRFANLYGIFIWLIEITLIDYLVLKYKLPKAWILVAFFLSGLLLPFLFSSIEKQKNKKE